MLKHDSKKDAIRHNLIRIIIVIVLTAVLHKFAGLQVFLSIIIAYLTGLAMMLFITYVMKKNNQ